MREKIQSLEFKLLMSTKIIWKKSEFQLALSKVIGKSLIECTTNPNNLYNISLNCVMCDGLQETLNHLMLHCAYAMKAWDGVMTWLGFSMVIPPNLLTLWECWEGVTSNKKTRKGLRMIWHTVVWSFGGLETIEFLTTLGVKQRS